MKIALAAGAALCLAAPALADAARDVIDAVAGHYAQGDTMLHAAPVELAFTDDAVYLELVTKGDELNLSQMILTFHEQEDGSVVARFHAFPALIGDVLAVDLPTLAMGLWSVPDLFPKLEARQLDPLGHANVQTSGDGVSFSIDRAPFASPDAPLTDVALSFSESGASWMWTGYGFDGESVWNERFGEMTRADAPDIVSENDGITIIDIREGDGVRLAEGDMIAMNYIGVLSDGRRFDATRNFPQRTSISAQFPGRLWRPIVDGLEGVACPTRVTDANRDQQPIRKIVIPPDRGFGEEGSQAIPPNETLYMLLLVESILDKTPDGPVIDE